MFNVKTILLYSVLILFLAAHSFGAESVFLKGANGRIVEFAGVRSAGPQGLILLMQADGDEMLVGWDKIDLEDLKKHDKIYSAYQNAQSGRKTTLNLGVYEGAMSQDQFLRNLKAMLLKEDAYKAPRMTDIEFDRDLFNYENRPGDYVKAQRKTEKIYLEYRLLMEEFFGVKEDQLKTRITTIPYGDETYRVIDFSSLADRSKVNVSRLSVIKYFADSGHESYHDAIDWFTGNDLEFQGIVRELRDQQKVVNQQLLASDNVKLRYSYLLGQLQKHFTNLGDSSTMEKSLPTDMRAFLEEMQLR